MRGRNNKMSITIKARIESYEVQPNDIVRPSTLFRLFQKASGDDLDQIGLTYDFLRDNGIVFVLTKITLKYFENIHSYDIVEITTRPRCCKGVSFVRDFDVFVSGKRVAYATSTWVLLDINSRKLLRPSAIDKLGTIKTDSENIITIEDRRMKFDTTLMKETDVREVYYSQIDRNGHMNNTFYPDIVYDYFPDEYKDNDKGKIMSVYYSSEVMRSEKIQIYTKPGENEFLFVAKNPDTGKDIFTSLIDF